MKMLLKTLVGSRAHGLNNPDSDYDYRGVFIHKTSELLTLDSKMDQTAWDIGGETDNTAYELSKFLHMASTSNATVLEVLHGPVIESTPEGLELKALFPYMWSSEGVLNSFRGYSLNQRKKFLDDKDGRSWKYAVAYIRVLLLGIELLRRGTITVNLIDQQHILRGCNLKEPGDLHDFGSNVTNIEGLRLIRAGSYYTKGQVIDWANYLEEQLVKAYEKNSDKQTDFNKLNEYLLKIRKENW